jgi:large subunit ribosomal protein L9
MDVILLEKIDNVGGIGDQVSVKSGFARNYLIPKGKATLATPENIAKFESRRMELEAKANAELAAARGRAVKLEGQVLRLRSNAGPEGKLFGSIGTMDIADACTALGVEVERSEVRLPDGPLRVVGEHTIELHLHSDVNVEVTVIVEAAEGGPTALDTGKDIDDDSATEDGDGDGDDDGDHD